MNLLSHNSFEKMADISAEWNNLLTKSITNSPFLRFEFQKTWWQHKGGGEWEDTSELFVIEVRDGNELLGIAPFFLSGGSPNTLALVGSTEICDVLDIIVEPENHERVLKAVLSFVEQELGSKFSRYLLINIPVASPTLAVTQEFFKDKASSVELEKYQPSPYIPLSTDFESYLSGIDKKQRHEVRRKIRRAEESERGVRWYFIETKETLDQGIDSFFALMVGDPGKESFLTPKMRKQMIAIVETAYDTGTLKFAFLEIDGEVAASYLNFDYNNKLWVYNSGYDRKFNELSAGWVLLGYLIEWAANNHRTEFDFMRGDEDYKFKFGGIDRPVMKLTISL